MAKTAPAPAPPAADGSFGNSTNPADPRFRNIISPPQTFVTPSIPPQQAPTVPNPLAALAALLPQAQSYVPYKYVKSDNRQPATPSIDPQKLAIIQLLIQQGFSIEQIAPILNAQQQQQQQQQQQAPQQYPLSPRGRRRDSRSRSPPPRRRSPSRSLSPPPRGRGRGNRRRENFDSSPPPQRYRRSPSYDDYRRRSPSRSRSPPNFRRNSPPPRERSPIQKKPPPITELKEIKPRYIEYDDSLKPDRIRGNIPHPFESIWWTNN